jgi:hypothetical protein
MNNMFLKGRYLKKILFLLVYCFFSFFFLFIHSFLLSFFCLSFLRCTIQLNTQDVLVEVLKMSSWSLNILLVLWVFYRYIFGGSKLVVFIQTEGRKTNSNFHNILVGVYISSWDFDDNSRFYFIQVIYIHLYTHIFSTRNVDLLIFFFSKVILLFIKY